jgi:hypothetical protein
VPAISAKAPRAPTGLRSSRPRVSAFSSRCPQSRSPAALARGCCTGTGKLPRSLRRWNRRILTGSPALTTCPPQRIRSMLQSAGPATAWTSSSASTPSAFPGSRTRRSAAFSTRRAPALTARQIPSSQDRELAATDLEKLTARDDRSRNDLRHVFGTATRIRPPRAAYSRLR